MTRKSSAAEVTKIVEPAVDVGQVLISELHESPMNPRRTFGDMTELVDSVRRLGILQPLLIRSVGEGKETKLEVVFGHRRLRAAKKAGLTHVPCRMWANLSDEDVIEAQLVENVQRADVHPMEEAEGYERLAKMGKAADEIASRIGKSRSYVFGRMKLLELGDDGRKAFYAGRLNSSTALLISRIPGNELQAKAIEAIAREGSEPLSYKAALEVIHEHFTLRLSDAPFPTKDDLLLPEAGPCTSCPKRSGNNPDLFGDIGKPDVCTDPTCFSKKVAANLEAQKAKHLEKGNKVLSSAEGKRLFKLGGLLPHDSKYVELNGPCSEDKDRRTWRKLLGDSKPQVYAAADPGGRYRELVLKDEALAALKTEAPKVAKAIEKQTAEDQAVTPLSAEERQKQKLEREIHEKAQADVLDAVIGQLEKEDPADEAIRIAIFGVLYVAIPKRVLERRGLPNEAALEKELQKLKGKKLVALLFEVCVSEWLGQPFDGATSETKALAKTFGIDLKKAEKEARAWAEAQEKVASEERARKAPNTEAKTVCQEPACTTTIMAGDEFCSKHDPAKKKGKA